MLLVVLELALVLASCIVSPAARDALAVPAGAQGAPTRTPTATATATAPAATPTLAPTVAPVPSNWGIHGGWAIDDAGEVSFPHSLLTQMPLIQDSGAGWVRINFRLGQAYSDWTTPGSNGVTALQQYDRIVDAARGRSLKVLGLFSNDTWHGGQADWTANSAEQQGGDGDNEYLRRFSRDGATVLAKHFQGRIDTWQVWNEPNIWLSNPRAGVYEGETFLYPSNFAWLLRHVYEDTRAAGLAGLTLVSGGVAGSNHGGPGIPQRGEYRTAAEGTFSGVPGARTPTRTITPSPTLTPSVTPTPSPTVTPSPTAMPDLSEDAPPTATPLPPTATATATATATPTATPTATVTPLATPVFTTGARYLTETYRQGVARAGWDDVRRRLGSYPLDAIGQHLYVDQGDTVSAATLRAFLDDLRSAYVGLEGAGTTKGTFVTEFGWTSPGVESAVQSDNLQSAFAVFRTVPYLRGAFWFTVQDIPEAGIQYGLHTGGDPADGYSGTRKLSFSAYQSVAGRLPIPAGTGPSRGAASTGGADGVFAGDLVQVAGGQATIRVPGRARPLVVDVGTNPRTPDVWCRRDRAYRAFLRLDDPAATGATFGLADGGYLDWIAPDEGGCVDWRKVDANVTVPRDVIMQFRLQRLRPGALLWVQDGDEFWRGRMYEITPEGRAQYVTRAAWEARQPVLQPAWENVLPTSWRQIADLQRRGMLGPDR